MNMKLALRTRAASLGLGALAFAGVSLAATAAMADSSVYVTNNTSKELVIQTSSTLPSRYWKKKSTVIPPFSRREVYETNREDGVKKDKNFFFTSKVKVRNAKTKAVLSQQPDEFALRLKLRGQWPGSHMWQGVRSQAGSHSSWADDRQKYGSSMNIKGTPWNVTYWAYATGGDDDVEYVIRENYPLPQGFGKSLGQEWKSNHLNILSYNVYMRPTGLFKNGQMKRAKMIPAQLRGYDVVVFQEAFDNTVRAELIRGMKKQGYKYASDILGTDRDPEQDGGVIIVSRYPIVKQDEELFEGNCADSDCLADKGILYVKINKKIGGKDNFYNVFGTHLNTGGPAKKAVQKKQLRMMRDFIKSQKIPKEQAVLIAGDMNINRTNAEMYNYMLSTLSAGYFAGGKLKGHPFSHDGPLNDLGEGGQSYLDYVLYSKAHRSIATASYAEVRVPRAISEWKEFAHESAMWDLSDHYAVYGNYHFKNELDFNPGTSDPDQGPISCTTDAECPTGMKCERGVAGASGGSSGGTRSTAKVRRTRGSVSKGLAKPAQAPKGTRYGKASSASKALKPIAGICRVPPPK